jgi:hypothetical protein
MLQGIFDRSLDGAKRLSMLTPTAIKNLIDVGYAIKEGGYTNSRGQKLVKLDFNNPQHSLELLGRIMGFPATRMKEAQEQNAAYRDAVKYYSERRELLIGELSKAMGRGTAEEKKAALGKMRELHKTFPKEFC